MEGGIKLVAVRGHRGRPGGQGRSKGRRSRSGGGEMRNRRGGTSGGGEDGRMREGSRRRKAERSTSRGKWSEKARP